VKNISQRNYALLAFIIELVSEMKYADFLKENIYKPLGMDQPIITRIWPRIINDHCGRGGDSVESMDSEIGSLGERFPRHGRAMTTNYVLGSSSGQDRLIIRRPYSRDDSLIHPNACKIFSLKNLRTSFLTPSSIMNAKRA